MIKLSRNKQNKFLIGSTLLSTGGGGSLKKAAELLSKIPVQMVSLDDLNPNDIVCTVFGVGGKQVNDPVSSVNTAFKIFKSLFKKKIKAIIPVELGPLSTAIALYAASKINLPIVDADIVGERCSPEVFIETITLKKLKREPAVISNGKDSAILYKSSSFEFTEVFFRDFAQKSGGDAFVVGYPLRMKDINTVVAKKSISNSISIGSDLIEVKKGTITLDQFIKKNKLVLRGGGKITQELINKTPGFRSKKYVIVSSNSEKFEIITKNENIVIIKNDKILLTVPDLICLLDNKSWLGINNFESNKNKKVIIFGKKAIPIWRTKKGKKLFSPRNLGFSFRQKIL